MISFLIPAKNSSLYIKDCLFPFINYYYKYNFEVIIIDDFSTDDTFEFTKYIVDKYERINIFKNLKPGKNNALNYAFTIANGKVIKCVDSDDVISELLFKYLEDNKENILVHDAYIVDNDLKILTYNKLSTKFYNSDFNSVIKYCISPARWVWSFPYEIGNKIFPIPEDLPFEDFWFSIILANQNLKKYIYINKPLYFYRQHTSQEYGGLFNFNRKNLIFRSRRLKIYYDFLLNDERFNQISRLDLQNNYNLFEYISTKPIKISSYIFIKTNLNLKFKFFLLLFFPKIALFIFKIKINRFSN